MSDTILSALTAAGGNSRAARSLRARLQWRDRFGRWIEMGRGIKFKVRGVDGAPRSVIGSFVGAKDKETGQVYVSNDPNGIPDGFYDVSSRNAQEFVATLTESQLSEKGITLGKNADGQAVGERASEDIPNISELQRLAAPEGWIAQPGTYNGKKVIATDDGDFRIHFGGADETALLEDHRARPGVADPQRSVAEAFAKVAEVDERREAGGDQAYVGLSENNDQRVADLGRDQLIESIKLNERTITNERASIDAKQRALEQNEQIKADLAAKGFDPYDPEGKDSDEAIEVRNSAPAEQPEAAGTPTVSTGDIDTSTFDVAPEGFLVPTGKITNDITPQGLANFMNAEKETLGKGGARLVVDTDAKTAEIYNSADTLDNAKAQAGGLGQDRVLDLKAGNEVQVSEGAVDPNSADVNPNLDGDTSPEAPNAQDRNPDAVESQPASPGTDAPASPEPDREAQPTTEPAPTDRPAGDTAPSPDNGGGTDRPADAPAADERDIEDLRVKRKGEVPLSDLKIGDRFYDGNGDLVEVTRIEGDPGSKKAVIQNEDGTARSGVNSVNRTVRSESGYTTDKRRLKDYDAGSIEELLERRAKVQEALDLASSPKDVIALNDQADELDARISAKEIEAPTPEEPEVGNTSDAPEEAPRTSETLVDLINSLQEKQDRLQDEIERGASGRSDDDISAELDRVFDELADLQAEFERVESGGDYNPDAEVETDLKGILDSAWAQTDPYPESWIEKRERAALRILRDAEAKGDLQSGIDRLSDDEKLALTDDVKRAVGIQETAPEEPTTPDAAEPAPEAVDTTPEVNPLQQAYDDAEAERRRVFADPASTDEQMSAAEDASDAAWEALNGTPPEVFDEPETDESILDNIVDQVIAEIDARTPPAPAVDPLEEERARLQDVVERNGDYAPRTDGQFGTPPPLSPEERGERVVTAQERIREITDEINAREATEAAVDPSEGTGGLYERGDDPYNVESGNENKVSAALAKIQGKDMSDAERAELEEILDSPLSDNQIARVLSTIDNMPNRSNTVTMPRRDREQPEYLSTADVEVIDLERENPDYVFDEDLTWRRILEEFPNAQVLDNGDLILDTTSNKNKRYDAMIRRTNKNRFLVYVMETDQQGNRRAKRIGNTEWHSYEALEKRIQQSRKLISSKSPAGSLARRKDQPTEDLGTQGFPADDFLGYIGDPNAAVPTTGDDKFDALLAVAADHIRNAESDIHQIEAALQEVDPGANAINTIMQAIVGRAQDAYRPDGVNPWQMYDGETAEIGMHFDWTDWHQELDWWLPNGQLNKDRKVNPNFGDVRRGRVVGYVRENTDGKGHTYGDHVWVQIQNDDGSWGNWVKRSAQTLRRADEGSATGMPFFSKREEWRTNPEALARRFRVPNVAPDENVQTSPRPRAELAVSRRLRFTSKGTLAGYSNVPVPTSQAEIASMIMSGQVQAQFRPGSDARPGMMIVRMDDNGGQFVDTIIRVDNLGDGTLRIHAARPTGRGFADVDNFVVSEGADLPLWTSPGASAPTTPEPSNRRQGELVSYTSENSSGVGVILHDDGNGNVVISTPGNETIDILKSNISKVENPDVSTEQRQDLLEALGDHDIPQYIKNLISQGVLSPGLSAERYQQLVEITETFAVRTAEIRDVDAILDIMGATDQQRADTREFFNATEGA